MRVKPGTKVSLKDYDPADTGRYSSAEDVEGELHDLLKELRKLQEVLYAENHRAVLIVLQGMDASGKDGTVTHVMSGLIPLGVKVVPFKAPNTEELHHDFLWRIHQALPRYGDIGIFNRSHYEDVLVVRVHELVPRKVWKERYDQINDFEKILTQNNLVILKFFLHISKDEQRKRLQDRLKDPTRYWKFSLNDVEERRFWGDYKDAYEDVLSRCSTKSAPWHIVPANHKWYRNLVVARTLVETLREMDLQYPEPTTDLSKVVIE
jgi:PPK2 family polyphosphate:nucleotide phosphotransferase